MQNKFSASMVSFIQLFNNSLLFAYCSINKPNLTLLSIWALIIMTLWQIWLCLFPMPHYGHGCGISTLIMVPINFWRNTDLFKKSVFLAQKLIKLEHFIEYLSNFLKIISKIQNINLWNVFVVTLMILSINGNTWLTF